MVAYIVFTRERTRNQAELDTYSQTARPPCRGTPSRRAHSMAVWSARGRGVEGVAISSSPTFDEAKAGTTAPPIARCASIDTKAPIIASSSSKACDAKRLRAGPKIDLPTECPPRLRAGFCGEAFSAHERSGRLHGDVPKRSQTTPRPANRGASGSGSASP